MQQIYDAIKINSINYPFKLIENQGAGIVHVFASKDELVGYLNEQFGKSTFGKMTQKQIDLLLIIMQQV